MRIFVSSVRVGLEQERDSLKGFIRALGHEPVMFEDFTAQPVPSREACLEGARSCDVYLLLLGARYGHPFPETGLSPTAEEHVAARTAGIPRLVMRKTGVEAEPRQQQLIEEIRSYRDGVFYNEFTDVADLQTKVAAALRQAEQAPGPLTFAPLPAGLSVQWRRDWPQPQQGRTNCAALELHVVPGSPETVPSRVLRELPGRLANELRVAGVGSSAAVPTNHDSTVVWAHVVDPDRNRRGDEVSSGALLGCRVASTGQVSVWSSLPTDTMGSILDRDDLTERLGVLLRTAGTVTPVASEYVALAVGVDPANMLSEARITGVPRRRVTMAGLSRDRLTVPPDELVTQAAVGHGSRDAARSLAEALLTALRDSSGGGWF